MAKNGSTALAGLVIAMLTTFAGSAPAVAQTQPKNDTMASAAIGNVDFIDGPYSYKGKNDMVSVLGWKVLAKTTMAGGAPQSQDEVKFRLCDGSIKTVKTSELVRVQRSCPDGSPVGPWVVAKNGLVPADKNTTAEWLKGQKTIAFKDLPKAFREALVGSKPGEVAAFVFAPTSGSLMNLGVLDKKTEGRI